MGKAFNELLRISGRNTSQKKFDRAREKALNLSFAHGCDQYVIECMGCKTFFVRNNGENNICPSCYSLKCEIASTFVFNGLM